MNCLKCPNYWRTDIDETKCNQCGTQNEPTASSQESEVENDGEKASDLC
jgi:hypothetical protein